MIKRSIQVLVMCVVGIFILPEFPAAQPKRLIYLGEYKVKPGKVREFESVIRDFVEEMKKYDLPYSFYMFSTRDFTYYSINEFDNYAALDKFNEDWGEVEKKIGTETMHRYHKTEFGAIDSFKGTLLKFRPDHSYKPEKILGNKEVPDFVHMTFCSIHPSMKEQWFSVQLDWVILFERKEINMPFSAFTGDIGYDMPVWVYLRGSGSRKAYLDETEALKDILGEEGDELLRESLPLIKSVKGIECVFHPDLSYVPKNK